MTVQTFDAQKAAAEISVTESAAAHLKSQLAKAGKGGVRLSLKEAGCTGFKYVIEQVEGPEDGDTVVTAAEGVKLYVDTPHMAAFKGLKIDFVEQGLNKQLIMNNPNIKDECGCGESFSV